MHKQPVHSYFILFNTILCYLIVFWGQLIGVSPHTLRLIPYLMEIQVFGKSSSRLLPCSGVTKVGLLLFYLFFFPWIYSVWGLFWL